ncbi:MAG: 30S ribosomal protein S21 [Chloroflexi bacterium]|nr:30S ribosomal protein S21 [Chloroflexota bacterium]
MFIVRDDGESIEQFLGRYKKALTRSGILADLKKRRYYLSPGETRRVKEQIAERRRRRKLRRRPPR